MISYYSISGYMRTSEEVWTDLEVELPIQSLYLKKVGINDALLSNYFLSNNNVRLFNEIHQISCPRFVWVYVCVYVCG